jgi:hypothetical protein
MSSVKPVLLQIEPVNQWIIRLNRIFAIQPDDAHNAYIEHEGFTVWDLCFLQDLFYAENHTAKLLLDVGWCPHADPEGSYYLVLVKELDTIGDLGSKYDWNTPLLEYESRNYLDIHEQIKKIMNQYE